MDWEKVSLLGAMKTKMGWLDQRQKVLSENMANADTPHYRSRDLKPLSFKNVLAERTVKVPVAQTDAQHLVGKPDPRGAYKERSQRKPYETAPDGNSVVLDEQVMKVNETAVDHQLITELYAKNLNLIKTALGKR